MYVALQFIIVILNIMIPKFFQLIIYLEHLNVCVKMIQMVMEYVMK